MNSDFFRTFENRTIFVEVDLPPYLRNAGLGNLPSFKREHFLRNQIKEKVLQKFDEIPFILIVSDADEIPSSAAISSLKRNYSNLHDKKVKLLMPTFYYSFLWLYEGSMKTSSRSFAISDKYLHRHPSLDFNNNENPSGCHTYLYTQLLFILNQYLFRFD